MASQAIAADAGVTLDKKGQLPRDLAIEWRPVTQVARYPDNPRVNAGAVADVRASLEAYGWQQPLVVDAGGVIIVGDTRYLAALDMQQTHVPVYVARNLSPARARAYRLADNKTGERAEWHFPRLAFEFAALRDMGLDLTLTGFRPFEIDPIMASDWSPPAATGELGGEQGGRGGDEGDSNLVRFTPAQMAQCTDAAARARTQWGELSLAEAIARICAGFV